MKKAKLIALSVKDLLIELAVTDRLPMDLNELDESLIEASVDSILNQEPTYKTKVRVNKEDLSDAIVKFLADNQEEFDEAMAQAKDRIIANFRHRKVEFETCDMRIKRMTPFVGENLRAQGFQVKTTKTGIIVRW